MYEDTAFWNLLSARSSRTAETPAHISHNTSTYTDSYCGNNMELSAWRSGPRDASDETIDYRLNYHFTPNDLTTWPGKILILQSDDDPATTPAMRLALRNWYPQAQVHVFQQAGHTPFLSRPDEFYPLVQAFLRDR